ISTLYIRFSDISFASRHINIFRPDVIITNFAGTRGLSGEKILRSYDFQLFFHKRYGKTADIFLSVPVFNADYTDKSEDYQYVP
ncbi:MAG: hypothetical protein N3B13_09530, partial [Deltaproteobacteria bacterium]|nr:hypothetical protein [Deltaproteobacteria bacterium]